MTPPRESRNFLLGSSHPLPDLDLNLEAATRRRLSAAAANSEGLSLDIERAGAADRFLLAPSLRYRPDLAGNYRDYNDQRLETFIRDSLIAGRRGERVRFYDALASQFTLLQRAPAERVPALARQFAATLQEYSNFLQYTPDLSTEERLRFLFAAARIGQTYLSHFRRPPEGATLPPNAEALSAMLASALDEVDAQLQGYHTQLAAESYPLLPRLAGVAEIIALRRALHRGDDDAQRRHALALAEHLSTHPPTALDSSWHARAERGLLEDPEIVAQLRRFDTPSLLEGRSLALNAHSLEYLVLAAASLDRANEDSESLVRLRYRRFSAVVTALILRHPEWPLEELLRRLRNPADQADFIADLNQAQLRSAEVAGMLTEARGAQGLADLLIAAQETASHVAQLSDGIGRNLLPSILAANRRHHPLQRIETEVTRLPALPAELGLSGSQPGRELLRRRSLGLAQLREFQERHPEAQTHVLQQLLQSDAAAAHPVVTLTSELLEGWARQLHEAGDHEVFALHSLFHALEESREEGELNFEIRTRARSLRERSDGTEFRVRRMFGHLLSGSNLIALGAGILATEFLPTLLIARAGVGGSLALRGLPLVTRGAITPWGSVGMGLAVGTTLSAVGSGLHNLERFFQGLRTHFWRDFGASAGINLVTFGLTIPFSRILQNRLAAGARDPYLLGEGLRARDLAVHAGTVAFGGFTSLGLGFLGRGIGSGQWTMTGEEVAENVLSIAMWEAGAAGLRNLCGRHLGYAGQLGPHRQAQLEGLIPELVTREPSLAGRESLLTRLLAQGEIRHPGTLARYRQGLAEGRIPQLFAAERRYFLRLAPPEEIPTRMVAAPPPEVVPPAPEPARPVLIIWEREPILRLPASTEGPATSETITTRSDAPEAPLPVALEESPIRMEVKVTSEEGETNGVIDFDGLRAESELGPRILGREDFPFLPPELRRTLSRHHLELSLGDNGEILVRNLSRSRVMGAHETNIHGSWYYRDGEWHPIPSETAIPLRADDAISLGNFYEPVWFQVRNDRSQMNSRVNLGPSGRLRLGELRLVRSGEDSVFRLLGSGDTPIEVTRSFGSEAGQRRSYRATDNPVIGEIGETVVVSIGEGESRRSYRLVLDSPDRPAANLPEIGISYSNQGWSGRFRATEGRIDFGRNYQPRLFTARFISRSHFSIGITAHEGHPRYVLFVEAPHGIAIEGRHFPRGQSVGMLAGFYEMAFPMDNTGQTFDAPFQLRLPPIEGTFSEWRTGPLLPNHDRAVPPAPQAPPPLPRRETPPSPTPAQQPQAHPASPVREPSWRNLWGWTED